MWRKCWRFLQLSLCLLGLVAAVGYAYYRHEIERLIVVPEEAVYSIKQGEGLNQIVSGLSKKGVIANPLPLKIYAKLTGKASRLQAGDYLLAPQMRQIDLLEAIYQGEIITYRFRAIEGQTVLEMLAQLAANPDISHTLAGKTEAEIASLLGIDGALEGQFLPDTYYFHRHSSDVSVLKRMHEALKQVLDEAWRGRADELPLKNQQEALILASIIEKETAVEKERGQIAGVFIRRLQQNMRLQTDPSVIYGIKRGDALFNGVLTKAHLREDTPYNTYTRYGLPPTPIALASRESIVAATNPVAGQSLYFVADGEGGHVFSQTYAEHQQAVKAYRRKLAEQAGQSSSKHR